MFYLPYIVGVVGVIIYGAIAGLAGPGNAALLGAVRGEDGRLSTSKFQFFLWTGVVIFVWVALFVAQAVNPNTRCGTPGAAASNSGGTGFPGNVLLVMGFSVITLATAKGVTTAYVYAGRIAKGSNNPWKWSDLVCGDDGVTPDLSKIQMLTWTFIAAGSYLYSAVPLVAAYYVYGGSPSCGIPDINAALMALMGIGQGAYLGTKIVASSSVILRSLSKPQSYAGDTVTINGSGFGTTPGSVFFGSVAAALDQAADAWTDGSIAVVVPAIDALDNKPFEPGDTVMVGVLLTGTNGASSTGNTLPFTYTAAPEPPSVQAVPPSVDAQVAAQPLVVTASLSSDDANKAASAWLDDRLKARAVAEGGVRRPPLIYRLQQTRAANAPVITVDGAITPPVDARYVFFVDHHPHANWEHWCSYVFVSDDGTVSAVDSTVPPATDAPTKRVRLKYSAPPEVLR